jgi:hypothetical protein
MKTVNPLCASVLLKLWSAGDSNPSGFKARARATSTELIFVCYLGKGLPASRPALGTPDQFREVELPRVPEHVRICPRRWDDFAVTGELADPRPGTDAPPVLDIHAARVSVWISSIRRGR